MPAFSLVPAVAQMRPLGVEGHAVDAAPAAEIVEDAPAAGVPARVEVEAQQRHHAPRARVVGHVERGAVGGDDDPVRPREAVHERVSVPSGSMR